MFRSVVWIRLGGRRSAGLGVRRRVVGTSCGGGFTAVDWESSVGHVAGGLDSASCVLARVFVGDVCCGDGSGIGSRWDLSRGCVLSCGGAVLSGGGVRWRFGSCGRRSAGFFGQSVACSAVSLVVVLAES